MSSIFVKNLKNFADEGTLRQIFAEFGTIISCNVVRDKSGDSRGYGFVNFDNRQSAEDAIRARNGRPFKGNVLIVERKGQRGDRGLLETRSSINKKLFVKNLTEECNTDQKLRQLFGPYGYVTEVKVKTDKKGKPIGFGCVAFAQSGSADIARTSLNDKQVGDGQHLVVRPFYSRKYMRLMKTFIECQICTEKTSLVDVVSYGCDHQFCHSCVRQCLETVIEEGLLESLNCPDTSCDRRPDPSIIEKLVSEPLFHRYETLMVKKATEDMPEIMNCPNTECDGLIEAELDQMKAHCHKCDHVFCTNCLKPYHGLVWECVTKCDIDPSLMITQEIMSEGFVKSKCKRCPNCNSPIQKNEGCNHMTCTKCKHQFCWICLSVWSDVHYKCTDSEVTPETTFSAVMADTHQPIRLIHLGYMAAIHPTRPPINSFPNLLDTFAMNDNHP